MNREHFVITEGPLSIAETEILALALKGMHTLDLGPRDRYSKDALRLAHEEKDRSTNAAMARIVMADAIQQTGWTDLRAWLLVGCPEWVEYQQRVFNHRWVWWRDANHYGRTYTQIGRYRERALGLSGRRYIEPTTASAVAAVLLIRTWPELWPMATAFKDQCEREAFYTAQVRTRDMVQNMSTTEQSVLARELEAVRLRGVSLGTTITPMRGRRLK